MVLIRGWLQQWDAKSSGYGCEALWSPGSGTGLRLRHPGLRSGFVTLAHGQAKDKSPVPRFLLPVHLVHTALSICAQRLGDASVRSTINAKMPAYGR